MSIHVSKKLPQRHRRRRPFTIVSMAMVLVLMPGPVLSPDRYAAGLAGEHSRELRRNPMYLCLGIDAVSPKSRKPLMEAVPSVTHGLCKTDGTGTHARTAKNPESLQSRRCLSRSHHRSIAEKMR